MTPAHASYPSTLQGWLDYLTSIHPTTIELGLERTKTVFNRLALDFSKTQIVTVAGTNGKGTTCALLESMALKSGRSVGVYSSPHLQDYRERVRVNQQWFSEEQHCQAFAKVEAARADVSLTYFEFGTLAALVLFAQAAPDVLLLEVGLGGRLDATNIVDPNLAIITTIALDHQEWLGDDREHIGREKAGIIRKRANVVVGDPEPPESLVQVVDTQKAKALWQGRDFGFASAHSQCWLRSQNRIAFENIPQSAIPKQNISTALAANSELGWLEEAEDLRDAIATTRVPGRCQWLSQSPKVLVDVAHNPQSTAYLAEFIGHQSYNRLLFVCGMLSDKDSQASLAPMQGFDAEWFVGTLSVPRGAEAASLANWLDESKNVVLCPSVIDACEQASHQLGKDDLLVVFGSFYTVADAMSVWSAATREKTE